MTMQDKQTTPPIRVIAVMGDSHTWGEGVGAEYGFVPPVVGADKRMNSFTYPAYVNLLRDAVNLRTGSTASEWTGERLFSLCASVSRGCGAVTPDAPLTISSPFRLCRVFLCAGKTPVDVTFSINGKAEKVISGAASEDPSFAVCVFPVSLFAEEGRELSLSVTGGEVLIHRVELYDGPYAVVNAGIGSCPVGAYLDRFFDTYIAALRPYALLFEGCTINDWLTGGTTADYAARLTEAAARLRALTPRVMAHSVFPVAGAQVFGVSAAPYPEFVQTMKDTLTGLGMPFCDTYAVFLDELSRVPEARRGQFLYHDPWHPNGTGHYIYAREILPMLLPLAGIG